MMWKRQKYCANVTSDDEDARLQKYFSSLFNSRIKKLHCKAGFWHNGKKDEHLTTVLDTPLLKLRELNYHRKGKSQHIL